MADTPIEVLTEMLRLFDKGEAAREGGLFTFDDWETLDATIERARKVIEAASAGAEEHDPLCSIGTPAGDQTMPCDCDPKLTCIEKADSAAEANEAAWRAADTLLLAISEPAAAPADPQPETPAPVCCDAWCSHTHYCIVCRHPVLQRVNGRCADCHKAQPAAQPEALSVPMERTCERCGLVHKLSDPTTEKEGERNG